jgi:DNA-binding NarL/FixJ family response regulator
MVRPHHALDWTTFDNMKSSGKALQVVLADDHHFFREGLRGVLAEDHIAVVGEAANGEEAVALVGELTPDVLVIDLNMPGSGGVDAIRRIVASSPAVEVVVLTVSADGADVLQALAAGASSYLLKDTRSDELAGCIRQAASGYTVLSREVTQTLSTHALHNLPEESAAEQPGAAPPALTARELDVLALLVEGADNAAIGRELSISPHTVKQYMTNIFEKLEVKGRVQAAVYAVRAGLA